MTRGEAASTAGTVAGTLPAPRDARLAGVSVRNFRTLRSLEIDGLGRVNLFGGYNQAGKTTLLQALQLLAGAEPDAVAPGRPAGWWLHGLDEGLTARIEGRTRGGDAVRLTLRAAGPALECVRSGNGAGPVVFLAAGGDQDEQRAADAGRLAALQARGRERVLLEALRRLPQLKAHGRNMHDADAPSRLASVAVRGTGGAAAIWCDVGLAAPQPLGLLGTGTVAVARLVLAIAAAAGGTVLADGIENSLHYRQLVPAWRIVFELVRQHDVQLFAATHSQECIHAAHHAVRETPICDPEYFRLDALTPRPGRDLRHSHSAAHYEPDHLAHAVEFGSELR